MTQIKSPWQTKKTRFIYENPWIKVREDDVIQPDGKPGIYGVVHFKNTAIGVLPIDEDDKICLVGQYRYPIGTYSWEIPEGGCAEGEEHLEAAKRELVEETGMVAANWTRIGTSYLSNSVSDELAVFYLATGLTRGEPNPEGTEQLAYNHVSFDQALDMVMQGEITDALSVLAITRYGILRAQKKV
ncbi:hypothetical protein BH10CYA1_BH10CYA1_49320 [soil metagenome]